TASVFCCGGTTMTLHNAGPGLARLRRRDFLALGSLAALTPLLPRAAHGSALPDALAAPAAQARPLPLSVGYLEGSELLSNLRKLQPDLTVLTVQRRGGTFTAGRRMLP